MFSFPSLHTNSHMLPSVKKNIVDHKQSGVSKATKAKVFIDKAKKKKQEIRKANVEAKKKESTDKHGKVAEAAHSAQKSNALSGMTPTPRPMSPPVASSANVSITQTGSIQAVATTPIQQQTTQPPSSIAAASRQSASLYYPNLPLPERVEKLVQEGCSNEVIALRLDVSLKAVMDARKNINTNKLIKTPRDMFATQLSDFQEAFDTAKSAFFDDPTSEVNYKMLSEFAKTMRELVSAYNDLEDPQELARIVTHKCLRPLVLSVLKTVVESSKSTLKSLQPFLKPNEQVRLYDGMKASLKSLQEQINQDYNTSVEILEKIYGVGLTNMKVTKTEAAPDVGTPEQENDTDS